MRRRGTSATNPQGSRLQFLKLETVASLTGLHVDTIRRAIRDGELVAHKFRGQWRVEERDLEAWIRRCRFQPSVSDGREDRVASTFRTDFRW